MQRLPILLTLTLYGLLLTACSTSQIKLQSDLVPDNGGGAEFVLKDSVTIEALHAKPIILKSATRWYKVGSIDKGVVYNTHDQVVIINSFNAYEGYIVVNQGKVVGCYLPTEKTFAATKPVTINLTKQ